MSFFNKPPNGLFILLLLLYFSVGFAQPRSFAERFLDFVQKVNGVEQNAVDLLSGSEEVAVRHDWIVPLRITSVGFVSPQDTTVNYVSQVIQFPAVTLWLFVATPPLGNLMENIDFERYVYRQGNVDSRIFSTTLLSLDLEQGLVIFNQAENFHLANLNLMLIPSAKDLTAEHLKSESFLVTLTTLILNHSELKVLNLKLALGNVAALRIAQACNGISDSEALLLLTEFSLEDILVDSQGVAFLLPFLFLDQVKLEHMSLSVGEVDSHTLQKLAEVLNNNKSLKSFKFATPSMSQDYVDMLSSALSNHPVLCTLELKDTDQVFELDETTIAMLVSHQSGISTESSSSSIATTPSATSFLASPSPAYSSAFYE